MLELCSENQRTGVAEAVGGPTARPAIGVMSIHRGPIYQRDCHYFRLIRCRHFQSKFVTYQFSTICLMSMKERNWQYLMGAMIVLALVWASLGVLENAL